MNRKAHVRQNEFLAGLLEQLPDRSYRFRYDTQYLTSPHAKAISLTLPLQEKPFESPHLFPFFVGLLAEGNLKEMQCRLYKIDPDDDFTRLLRTTRDDVIGAITVEEIKE